MNFASLQQNTSAELGSLRLDEFSTRFSELVFLSPAELVQLLEAAFKKLKEFSPILGLELPGSRFVNSVDNFLAEMTLLLEPGQC